MNSEIEQWFAGYIQYQSYTRGGGGITSVRIDVPFGTFVPFSLIEVIYYINNSEIDKVEASFGFYYEDEEISVSIYKDESNIVELIITKEIEEDDYDYKEKRYDIKIDRYKSPEELNEFLSQEFKDMSYDKLGRLFDQRGITKKNKASIKDNKNLLSNIVNLFDSKYQFKVEVKGFQTLPLNISSSGKKLEVAITLSCPYQYITGTEIGNIINYKEEYKMKIRHFVNNHLIFYSYVGMVRNIKLTIIYANSFDITIDVTIQLLTNEDFYRTVGALRGELKHICEVRSEQYRHEELLVLAKRIHLNISSINDDDLCQYLADYISTLSLKDFN